MAAADSNLESNRMDKIKHKVLVLSGKGGVGKSTTTVQLALALWNRGLRVGVLDVDLCGPSIPRMLGVQKSSVISTNLGWSPVQVDSDGRLLVMSLSYLVADYDAAVMWRGPKKSSIVQQFIHNVNWGDLDFLIVDTPPGTSDEHIAVLENLAHTSVDGGLLVTTPQAVAVTDVRKEASFCTKVGLPILGVVENMSGYVCPCCGEETNIFSSGGGEALAGIISVPFIGRVPIDLRISSGAESTDEMRKDGFSTYPIPECIVALAEKLSK